MEKYMYKLNTKFVSIVLSLAVWHSASATTLEEAAAIQRELITLDSHLDTPVNLVVPGFNILDRHSYAHDFTQVDVPRMREGALDGGFWVIYSPQGELTKTGYEKSRDTALLRALAVRSMVTANPDIFELAIEADDASEIKKSAKHIVYMSMENAYPLGTDVSLLDTFYKFGLRMVGPLHFKNNQFGDS
jgi:membrane dipeptidase